jgi:hypothetical protein
LFQAKWILVGGIVVAGLTNSDTLVEALIGFAK